MLFSAEVPSDLQLNTVWTITAALLVYFMHGGFGFFEAGMCRSKDTVDTLSHNLLILAVTIAAYWMIGFAFMFGAGNGFIGHTGFVPQLLDGVDDFPSLQNHLVPLAVAFAFAMSFADTPATLIAGSGAERIRFSAVMLLTLLISGVLFPIVGHWIIGEGWLARRSVPVYDTGSGMVHLCGGCCALAVAMILGPRIERFRREPRTKTWVEQELPYQVSSMPLVFLGAFILWLGFFGFNAGFAMRASRSVGLVIVNTALAGAFGTIAAMAGVQFWTGKARLRTAIVGLLAANVAVTSSSSVVEPWAAAVIGAAAGLITVVSIPFWARLGIDDPTEYLTMNLVGGVLGMISVGLFPSPEIMEKYPTQPSPQIGVFYGGGTDQLLSQIVAIGAIAGFIFPIVLVACKILQAAGWLRVDPKEEREGSDLATHGEEAYDVDE